MALSHMAHGAHVVGDLEIETVNVDHLSAVHIKDSGQWPL